MNHIYRSIWNHSTATYVAVAETSKSGGKKAMGSTGSLPVGHWAFTALAASLCLAYAPGALALPQGGVVAGGSASVTAAPGKLTIVQGSQRAVLNWLSFGIGVGEAVQFVQPDASAVALNRVMGTDPSAILGNLSGNGKVFLVNPNGILFGKGASVNVGGLVASTLGITDADFMAGRYKFSGSSGNAVINQGTIDAPGGYVALLGAHVGNQGVIAARMGSVALAGGQAITLDVAGDGLLNVAIDRGAVNALVSNGGLIQADGGQVLMTAQAAGKLLNTVVNNTGVIQAQTLVDHNGSIKLLGDMHTGTVVAGGTLDASAPAGGNGGFVETSAAHVRIDDALKVTTAAPAGLTGSWLIDPTDYTIAATGGDQTGAFYTNALKSSNVQIQSVSGGSGVAGDININDTISWSAHQLKLTAQNNININAAMRGSGTASLALEYGQQAVAAGNSATYNVKAEVDLPAGQNFSTRLGSDGTAVVYTVIDRLGAATSTNGMDLQGAKNALGGNFVLGANIDASGTANTAVWGTNGFTPIGTPATPFTGQFDGLGHVINGLNSSTSSSAGVAGLFGSNAGSVRNIGLVAPVIGANIAAAQGNIAALAAINSGTISNAYASGGSVTVTVGAIGAGLVGLNSGTIRDSHNSSKVSVVGNYDFWLGGLVGNTTKTSTIINSYNSGEVSGAYTAGGLAGNNLGNITNSFNSGNVTGTSNAGGLASYNRATAVINSSFNTGAVTSNSLTGGLVGSNVASGQIINSYSTGAVSSRGGTGSGFGGLAGGNSGVIRNSYATGAVTGVTAVGGLIGSNTSAGLTENAYASGAVSLRSGGSGNLGGLIGSIAAGTSPSITGGYYNATVNPGLPGVGTNGGPSTPSITGLTSAQMQTASNFSAFAFTTTAGATGNNWVMVDTDGTLNNAGGVLGATGPMLASEYNTTVRSAHQLQLMAMSLAGNFTLGKDIDAAGTGQALDVWNGGGFVPVGASTAAPFTGTLDGAGHVVSGLVVNRPGTNYAGLFGATSATGVVRNIGLEGGSITGLNATGALVGNNLGLVSGSYSTASVTGSSNVGGLVGANGIVSSVPGIVTDSYASGAVTGTGVIGGLVGLNTGTLTNSHASGTVTGGSTQGGLVGNGGGTATGNFWDTTSSGLATSATGTGLTTAQMKMLSTYTTPGWDLAGTWIVYDGNTTPLLRAFMTPLLVTFAPNTSKTYDGTNAWTAPAASYSNPNASVLGSLTYGAADSAVNAGTYAITAGGLYSGQHGYAIGFTAATLTIAPKAATLSGASVVSRAYDGTTAASLTGGSLSGVLTQDVASVSVTTGTFDTKDAGVGKTVTALVTGSAGGNYAVTAGPLTGDITPKALTITGVTAASKVYDGSSNASLSGGTLSGLVGGETLTVSGQTGTFSDKNAGIGKVVTVSGTTLVDGTGLAGNYSVANPTGVTGDITKKALTITGVTATNRAYTGGTAVSLGGSVIVGGLVGSEGVGVGGMSGVFVDKNVGTAKAVTITGAVMTIGSNGGLVSNYTISNPTGVTADITKATISAVTNIAVTGKAYDGTLSATVDPAGATFGGIKSGDSLTVSATTATFGDKNVGTGKTVTISGIALGGTDAGNYNLTATTGSSIGNITPKALTIVGMSAVNKVYDGNTKASVTGGSISGLVGSETLGVTGLTVTFADKNAGTAKAVTATGTTLVNGGNGGLAANYSMSNPTGFTANITPKALTVSGMTAGNRAYDGTTSATLSGGSLSGVVSGETLVIGGGSGVFADKNVGNGKAVTVSGVSLANGTGLASNYTVTNPTTVTGSVTPKALTIIGMTAVDKVYDGNTKASVTGGSINGLVGSETLGVTGLTVAFVDKNAGTAKAVTATGTTLVNGGNGGLASNYSMSNPTGFTADITPKALTIVGMSAVNKVYDGNTKASVTGGSISGLVGSETLGVTGLTVTFADKNAGTAKAVTATGTTLVNGGNGGLASNYSMSNPTGFTANITPKALTVSGMTAGSRVYDGTTSATLSGGSLSGVVSGETLVIGGGSGVFADKNVGNGKAVTVSGVSLANGTGLASNYTVTNPTTVTGSVTPKALTIIGMTAVDKVYDGNTNATLTGGALSGLVGSETLGVTGLTAVFADKNAGVAKALTASGSTLVSGSNGGLAGNYSVSNPTGLSADIMPKALTIVGMTAVNKVYDGSAEASLSGGSIGGLVGSETLGVTGLTATFDNKNAGMAKTVTAVGSTLVDGGNGGLAANYTIGDPTGLSADITPKALTITGMTAGTRVYDATTTATLSGGALSGVVGAETLVLSGAIGVFSDKNAGTGKSVIVSGSILADGTGLASNYTVSNPTTVTGSITPKALTVLDMAAVNKVYDGTTVAALTGGSLSGLVGSETLGLVGHVGTFDTAHAGTAKAVTVSGTALVDGSGLAGNYSVGNPTGLLADVTPKALTVTGVTAGNKVYDGNMVAALSGGSLSGLVGSETLGLARLSGAFSDKNAANGKTVTVTGASLVDGTGLASDYTVSNPGALTADIGKASIGSVGGITAGNKVYDGNTVASVDTASATFSGMVAGDSLSASAVAGAFVDKNAAIGKLVGVSGIALGGTDAANYSLTSNTASTTADITPKALTIAGLTAANKVFDGTTAALLSGGTLTGLVGNETLGLSGLSGAFDSASGGSGKAVTVTGSTLSDGSGLTSNYSVSNPSGLKADIMSAAVAVTLPPDRPTASNVDASVGVNSSPFASSGSRNDASGGLDVKSEGNKGPILQTGVSVPIGLAALRFTMTGNGMRLPAGVVPASRSGDN